MKMLHIAKYAEDRPSGIKTVIEELIPNQQKKGLDVNFLNLINKKNDKLKEKYDLIIFHGIYIKEYLYFYKKIRNTPYIIIPHCSLTKESLKRSRLKKGVFNLIAKKFYKNAKAIGFLNFEEKENSIRVNENFIILPNGINLPIKIDSKESLLKEDIKIIYLSRIDIYHKGLDLLLEAVKNIRNELLEKKIVINIYGNAFLKKNLDYLITEIEKNNLQKILKYHGRVDGENKKQAVQSSDLFILTSRFEGFPMSVLEGLSYGKPCILTEGTNMKGMIEKFNSGWVCKTNIDEISRIILYAIEEYRLNKEKYINNAFKNSEEYSWEKIVDIHLKEYKKILMEKS